VKISFALLLALAVLAFARNWHFISGYRSAMQSTRAAQAGNFVLAARLMQSASASVPDVAAFTEAALLYRAAALVQQSKYAEAVPLLESYVSSHSEETYAMDLLERAGYAAAFDRRDYDTMLLKAQAIAARHPGTYDGTASLASAHACKYAMTGQSEFRDVALRQLEEAKRFGAGSAESVEFAERMEHRIATRQIVDPAEFKRLFPNGWKRGAEPK
jgi:hypothetical protein